MVGGRSEGGSADDDRPEHEEGAATNEAYAAGDDVGDADGDEVGEELEG